MTERLQPSVRAYLQSSEVNKRYYRIDEINKLYHRDEEDFVKLASAAGAILKLPRITLIHKERLDTYMKHLYKVPNTGKYVQKKMVRIGEGSIMYSIGHHRFIEMARAAGAVYKINGSVFIGLDLFDEYLENFREKPVDTSRFIKGVE